jgi:hypothetical protein
MIYGLRDFSFTGETWALRFTAYGDPETTIPATMLLMTYTVMPIITRLCVDWLYPSVPEANSER